MIARQTRSSPPQVLIGYPFARAREKENTDVRNKREFLRAKQSDPRKLGLSLQNRGFRLGALSAYFRDDGHANLKSGQFGHPVSRYSLPHTRIYHYF